MNDLSDREVIALLRAAMPVEREVAPSEDLWPRVRGRIDQRPTGPAASDWLLVGALVALCLLQPSLLGVLLLHF